MRRSRIAVAKLGSLADGRVGQGDLRRIRQARLQPVRERRAEPSAGQQFLKDTGLDDQRKTPGLPIPTDSFAKKEQWNGKFETKKNDSKQP
jgi:hypothetical protein